ncbi:MAG: cell division protein ZapE [Pelagibacterales bacterium]|nr:cell division protein ZapE [Pelagibacterales bacterium]
MELDQHQIVIQKKLNHLSQEIQNKAQESFISKIFSKKSAPIKSIYIYGDVGRGKTMLMKEFFDSIDGKVKIYIHFNSFMRKIHEALRDIRKESRNYKDELIEAVQRITKDENQNIVEIICFDEFQVTDIADAMLLSRIFSYLFLKNIVIVFTSNSEPSELYKNGLQRELFLKFVNNVLLKNCEVLNLNSPTDYRAKLALSEKKVVIAQKEMKGNFFINPSSKNMLDDCAKNYKKPSLKKRVDDCVSNQTGDFLLHQEAKTTKQEEDCNTLLNLINITTAITKRYFISNQKNRTIIKEMIKNLTNNQLKSTKLNVWGREVEIKKTHNSIAVINFSELCNNNYAASDFHSICQKFDLIFLLRIPRLTEENINEARRFILFIDEVYENKTSLIVSAKSNIDQIYPSGIGSSAFKRTASRLKEIKTELYWKNSKFIKNNNN